MMLEKAILPFSEDDYLNSTGERIVADRYLQKDTLKETLTAGSLVMAVLDAKRAYHELAKVLDVDSGNRTVRVELRDGHVTELSFDRVDVLKETSPRQMWQRIAGATAQVTKNPAFWEQRFYALQNGWRYVPGGRINASMGTGIETTSYNCFVIPNVGWSVRDYAKSFGQTLEIQARSGGVGMNLSQVPPQGALTPVSERSRKGDLILAMDVWHEDIMDFLAQEYPNSTKVVRVSKAFLRAVEEGASWTYVFPDTGVAEYDEKWNGDLAAWMDEDLPVKYGSTLPASMIYDQIIESGAQMMQDLVGVVMNPGDSRGSIAETLGDMWEAMLDHKRITMLLSSLRPRYSYVRGVNGRSSGAYSWGLLYDKGNQVFGNGFGPVGVAEIMSVGCELTLQGGSRRGALMIILNDRHADIRKFITSKQVDGVITGANISVGISEEFMAAKASGEVWQLGYPSIENAPEFHGNFEAWLAEGKQLVVSESMPAEDLWKAIIGSAWKSAEPGVVFLGRYNKLSNSYYYNPIIATNPCGEQGLPAYGICNLGAVVLSKFAVGFQEREAQVEFIDPEKEAYIDSWLQKYFTPKRAAHFLHHVKWEELEEITRTGIRFQDAIIDATYYPFEENRVNQLGERRVGLGIMGLHDMLLYLGIRYGSKESVDFIDILMGMMAEWSYLESVELAKENGPFEKFEKDKFLRSGYMQMMKQERPHVFEAIATYGVRNVTTMTIAPTGTTGTMVGCSTGCEPYYAWSYYRNSRLGMFEENAAILEEYYQANGKKDLPDYFVTSMDLTPEEHVRVQAALQKWIDSSISKTVNAPNHYTVDDTKALYDLAYDLGCKGITIYRDGSRSEQVLSLKDTDSSKEIDANEQVAESKHELAKAEETVKAVSEKVTYRPRKRPAVLYGATYKKETPLGTAFITINDDPQDHLAREVFVNIGKAGTDVYAANEALGRAITLYLKDSQNPEKEAVLVKHFSGIGGHSSVGFGEHRISSVPDAIAKSLIEHYETFPMRKVTQEHLHEKDNTFELSGDAIASDLSVAMIKPDAAHSTLRELAVDKDLCPECHQHTLVRHGGCYECEACGYSKC